MLSCQHGKQDITLEIILRNYFNKKKQIRFFGGFLDHHFSDHQLPSITFEDVQNIRL